MGQTDYAGPASPQDLFLNWLLALQSDISIAEAARLEMARIDSAGSSCARLAAFKSFLHQATATTPAQPRRRRRLHH